MAALSAAPSRLRLCRRCGSWLPISTPFRSTWSITRLRLIPLQPAGTVESAEAAGARGPGPATYLARRVNRVGLDALGIAGGDGRRPTYSAAGRARIVATAQPPPDRKADGTATWSLSTLERTVRREGLPRVGATTIRRVLHDA